MTGCLDLDLELGKIEDENACYFRSSSNPKRTSSVLPPGTKGISGCTDEHESSDNSSSTIEFTFMASLFDTNDF